MPTAEPLACLAAPLAEDDREVFRRMLKPGYQPDPDPELARVIRRYFARLRGAEVANGRRYLTAEQMAAIGEDTGE
jgi:hypothetical protein